MSILTRKKEVAQKCAPLCNPTTKDLGNEIFSILYEPQANGLPDFSLGLVMSGKCRPEIQQFADNTLLQSASQNTYIDPDEALDFTPIMEFQLGREREMYAARVSNMFKKYIEKHEDVE